MRLDEAVPYADVIGLPGIKYEQKGHYFNLHGMEVDRDGKPILSSDPQPVSEEEDTPHSRFQAMHWKQLKALVESYGHGWVDKDDAVRFLNGQAN